MVTLSEAAAVVDAGKSTCPVNAPPVLSALLVKPAAVGRSSNLSPDRYALAVVPSCARTTVIESVARAVTLTISMLFEASIRVA